MCAECVGPTDLDDVVLNRILKAACSSRCVSYSIIYGSPRTNADVLDAEAWWRGGIGANGCDRGSGIFWAQHTLPYHAKSVLRALNHLGDSRCRQISTTR